MRKLKKQNFLIALSLIFLITSFGVYLGRFIYFYIDANKEDTTTTLYSAIKNNNLNNENFVSYPDSYYFKNNADNNYFSYSNIIFRIVKLESNKIVLISNNTISSLAFGEVKNFEDSYLNSWLNENLKNNLTNDYLKNYKICLTKTNKANAKCKEEGKTALSVLTLEDYVNTGASKSYINTNESFYLSNMTKNNNVWYVTDNNTLDKTDGTEIIGIKPVIVIDGKQTKFSGSGTESDPYKLEENNYFNKYVKLDNDLWQINKVNEDTLSLIKTENIKVNNKKIEYNYSDSGFEYNGILSKYLNTNYYNSLSYKNIILETEFNNAYYGDDNDYNYKDATPLTTKIGLYSIGDINTNKITNSFTMTGVNSEGDLVYAFDEDGNIYAEDVTTQMNITPCITIKTEILKKGTGTKEDPYVVE